MSLNMNSVARQRRSAGVGALTIQRAVAAPVIAVLIKVA
jgi:hypothetical protein